MADRHALPGNKLPGQFWPRLLCAALIGMLAFSAACAPAATPTDEMEHATAGEHEHEAEGEHEHSEQRIPNNGAAVRIVSPADGATIQGGEVEVKIETENFTLGDDGRHWHVYLDGSEVAMVTGADISQVLHGVSAGEHELEVTLADGEHQELEEGDTIHITVSQ